jgi:hypothetical protein
MLSLVACTRPPREVWFAPDLGSGDMVELFTEPELWSDARRSTRVFKFYEEQLLASVPSDCPACGQNILPRFVAAGAFRLLQSWGMRAAVEAPVLKTWSCTGDGAAALAMKAIDRVLAAGGSVSTLAMDEPFVGGRACGLPAADAIARTALFAGTLRNYAPGLEIGDIEAYPTLEPVALARWIVGLRLSGVRLSFLHLDVDRTEARRLGLSLETQLRPVQFLCRAFGISFGIIVWGQDTTSDAAYYADARGWHEEMTQIFGTPDHTIFQSWAQSEEGERVVPRNLPESDPTRFTHTRLIRESLLDSGR